MYVTNKIEVWLCSFLCAFTGNSHLELSFLLKKNKKQYYVNFFSQKVKEKTEIWIIFLKNKVQPHVLSITTAQIFNKQRQSWLKISAVVWQKQAWKPECFTLSSRQAQAFSWHEKCILDSNSQVVCLPKCMHVLTSPCYSYGFLQVMVRSLPRWSKQ